MKRVYPPKPTIRSGRILLRPSVNDSPSVPRDSCSSSTRYLFIPTNPPPKTFQSLHPLKRPGAKGRPPITGNSVLGWDGRGRRPKNRRLTPRAYSEKDKPLRLAYLYAVIPPSRPTAQALKDRRGLSSSKIRSDNCQNIQGEVGGKTTVGLCTMGDG